ncbi:MAG: hypothetical protein Q8R24_10115 [Legionellaceae bacterium]|nr:hypothetical protein [Legionellaceae bacterium]
MNEIIELSYGAQIQPDGAGYLVTFRDIENAFTYPLDFGQKDMKRASCLSVQEI